jgi:hypothetical protein
MRTVQEALKIAAQLVESTAIAGKRDTAAPTANSDGFYVRYEREEARVSVTLHVEMRLISSTTREMQLKVQLSHASEYRSTARTREFIALLTRCTELAEQIEAALSDTKFVFEVQS